MGPRGRVRSRGPSRRLRRSTIASSSPFARSLRLAHTGALEGRHLAPDERGRPGQMDEQRGARSLAEAQREVEVWLEPEVVQDEGVAGLRGAVGGEEHVA